MGLDSELIHALRTRFIDGATPSRLMEMIADRHESDPRLHHLIGDYFREAFGIALLRNVVPKQSIAPGREEAHFNRDVVPEMIQRLDEWNSADLAGSWLHGLKSPSLNDHIDRLKRDARFEELDGIWETLSEKQQQILIRQKARINHSWEVMKILASLAERLQEQVADLESRLEAAQQEKVGANGTHVGRS